MSLLPHHLSVPAAELGQGTGVQVVVKADMASIGHAMAADMLEEIKNASALSRNATFIVPVGPIEGFAILAGQVRAQKISLRDVMFINMDEYLDAEDNWVSLDHPLSFRAFMDRVFYQALDPSLAPKPENRVFPDPKNHGALQRLIDSRGGVDACFGGIGINGHIAFNEPPEPGEIIDEESFARVPTRNLDLSRETRTINSVTVGGDIALIPKRAVTVGMKEILAARKLRLYCNRIWQSAVVRRVLHGPITAACPASLIRTHRDARLTLTDYIAQPPEIRLR